MSDPIIWRPFVAALLPPLLIALWYGAAWFVTHTRVRLIVAWYDMWIGAYWDQRNRRLYLLPVPCVGLVIEFEE